MTEFLIFYGCGLVVGYAVFIILFEWKRLSKPHDYNPGLLTEHQDFNAVMTDPKHTELKKEMLERAVERANEDQRKVMGISLCSNGCGCMTKTVNGKCGKCNAKKP